jgi:LCP family protein required for cell wall assembly
MDNFRKPHRPARHSHSVDGFLSSRPVAPTRRQIVSAYQPQQKVPSIDNFSRADGFSAASLPTPVDTKAPLPPVPGFKSKRKQRKAKRTKFKKALRAGFVSLIAATVIVGGIAGYGYLKARQVFQGGGNAAALEKNVDPVKLKGEGDGRINIAMFGIGGEGHDGAFLTDTIMITSIDPVQNESALLSIPRDLWVQQSSGSTSKINAVFAYAREAALAKNPNDKDAAMKAGAAASEKVISSVIGIPIHYFVVVDFSGFEQAVNTVGGIDVTVTEDTAVQETLWDPTTRKTFYLNVQPGKRHLDGKTALFYSRSRHTSARGDFARADRQRQVLEAFKEKVEGAGTYANPVKVTQLLSSFGDHVRTDLTINEMSRLYDIGKNISHDKVASISLADVNNPLVRTGMVGDQSVVMPKAGLFNYTEIQSYVRNSLRDSFLKNENASILILNGTSIAGLAGKESTYLKSYGYNVTGIGDAPTKAYTKTVLVDMRNGAKKYTLNYLQKRLALTAGTSLPDPNIKAGTADFVLILGTDAQNMPNP